MTQDNPDQSQQQLYHRPILRQLGSSPWSLQLPGFQSLSSAHRIRGVPTLLAQLFLSQSLSDEGALWLEDGGPPQGVFWPGGRGGHMVGLRSIAWENPIQVGFSEKQGLICVMKPQWCLPDCSSQGWQEGSGLGRLELRLGVTGTLSLSSSGVLSASWLHSSLSLPSRAFHSSEALAARSNCVHSPGSSPAMRKTKWLCPAVSFPAQSQMLGREN